MIHGPTSIVISGGIVEVTVIHPASTVILPRDVMLTRHVRISNKSGAATRVVYGLGIDQHAQLNDGESLESLKLNTEPSHIDPYSGQVVWGSTQPLIEQGEGFSNKIAPATEGDERGLSRLKLAYPVWKYFLHLGSQLGYPQSPTADERHAANDPQK